MIGVIFFKLETIQLRIHNVDVYTNVFVNQFIPT